MRRGALMAMRNGGLIAPRLGFDKAVALGPLVLGETALLLLVATAAVQGSLRPGFGAGLAMLVGAIEAGRTHPWSRTPGSSSSAITEDEAAV